MAILWDEVFAPDRRGGAAGALPEPTASADDVVAAVEADSDRADARLFCSHVTSLAPPFSRRGLCAEARRRGIVSVVDGAHAPGQLELDLGAIGADVYAGTSTSGPAARAARPSSTSAGLQDRIRGPVVSWNWTWDGPEAFRGRFGWPGTVDPTSYPAVPRRSPSSASTNGPAVVAACRGRLERTIETLVVGCAGRRRRRRSCGRRSSRPFTSISADGSRTRCSGRSGTATGSRCQSSGSAGSRSSDPRSGVHDGRRLPGPRRGAGRGDPRGRLRQ